MSIQDYEATGPFGAEGVGETSRGAATASAICNAIGTRIYSLPMTPENILKALSHREQ